MEKEQFLLILTKYLDGQASPEEENFLYAYYKIFLADQDVMSLLDGKEKERLKLSIKSSIDGYLDQAAKPERKIVSWTRMAAAAAILLFLSAGAYFILQQRPQPQTAQNQKQDIAPGRNQATLTLAGGEKIVLNKGLSGKIARQGNISVQVNGGKAIAYTVSAANNPAAAIEYNTLTTARGEQSPYPLVLTDGTKVWLNAASSIRFPTAFNGKDREVRITGEADIEVAHDAAKTFRVVANGQTIEDIGTHFDVNAYEDEPVVRTTLLEGSVRVIPASLALAKTGVILRPGQQSVLDSHSLKVERANLDQVVSWRNGKFLFDDEQLAGIMRQAARWYNVEVVYEDESLKKKTFGGVTARFDNVSQLLHTLEMTNKVRFTIQGRKIIVQNK